MKYLEVSLGARLKPARETPAPSNRHRTVTASVAAPDWAAVSALRAVWE